MAGDANQRARAYPRLSIKELQAVIKKAAERRGLMPKQIGRARDDNEVPIAPGSRTEWEAALGEWVKNIKDYGCTPNERNLLWRWQDLTLTVWGQGSVSADLREMNAAGKADQGSGSVAHSPPVDAKKVWEHVKQLGQSPGYPRRNDVEESNGVGLYMVRGLLDAMGVTAELLLVEKTMAEPINEDDSDQAVLQGCLALQVSLEKT